MGNWHFPSKRLAVFRRLVALALAVWHPGTVLPTRDAGHKNVVMKVYCSSVAFFRLL
jgi:hypothetical protein